ncbi:putative RiPP precursor [Cereibacter sphaeroides]|uniref:Lasso RiPP family leader peptide-containing protein n=1 Tax=Cereibacter sphaeroides (strain ATCC 17025 / ATH 2.4.3) TaxID=349102 RepID=A4WR17_CERS5|nr:putative RiPP precursor [Cereibacter sphaeroides]
MDKEFQTYEAPVLRALGTLEEMTHGRGHGGPGHGRGPGRGRPHDPCDYTFS